MVELRVADDLNRGWSKNDLLFTLGFTDSARRMLCDWHWERRDSVSLDEVFELVISSDEDPRPGYIISRLLDIRGVGRKGLLGVLRRIPCLELGEKCRSAWEAKYRRFLDSHRVKGAGAYNWSFPLTEEGKLLARYKTGRLHLTEQREKAMRRARAKRKALGNPPVALAGR